jgi:hypothetical protein
MRRALAGGTHSCCGTCGIFGVTVRVPFMPLMLFSGQHGCVAGGVTGA